MPFLLCRRACPLCFRLFPLSLRFPLFIFCAFCAFLWLTAFCAFLWLESVAGACAFCGFFFEVEVLEAQGHVGVHVERAPFAGQ